MLFMMFNKVLSWWKLWYVEVSMIIAYIIGNVVALVLVHFYWDELVMYLLWVFTGYTVKSVLSTVVIAPVPVESKLVGTVRGDVVVSSGFLGLSMKTWVFIGVGVGVAVLIGYGAIHYVPLLFGAGMADQIATMRWEQLVELACQHGDRNGNDFLLTGLDEVIKLAVVPGAQIGQVEMGRQLCVEVVCQGSLVGDRLTRLAESAFQH